MLGNSIGKKIIVLLVLTLLTLGVAPHPWSALPWRPRCQSIPTLTSTAAHTTPAPPPPPTATPVFIPPAGTPTPMLTASVPTRAHSSATPADTPPMPEPGEGGAPSPDQPVITDLAEPTGIFVEQTPMYTPNAPTPSPYYAGFVTFVPTSAPASPQVLLSEQVDGECVSCFPWSVLCCCMGLLLLVLLLAVLWRRRQNR